MLTHERYVFGRGKQAALHFDAWDRFQGYEAAMNSAGLDPLVLTHPISGEVNVVQQFVDGGMAAIDAVLSHPSKPTAVVCYNDFEAYGLIRGASLKGIAIPEHLSLIGFGDLDHSRIVAPALTTVPVPAMEVGRQAAQGLLARIKKEPIESTSIGSELVVRESTASWKPLNHVTNT
jgi:LacI family transcriptional regulator